MIKKLEPSGIDAKGRLDLIQVKFAFSWYLQKQADEIDELALEFGHRLAL